MTVTELLGPHGPMADHIPGFSPRAPQQAMAEAVAEALTAPGSLVVEAGTGIGKTFAYLVPVLQAGRRTIVSTGTKHLQEQLFGRDLPNVMAALGVNVSRALLKGRANYLCLHRLDLALGQAGSRFRRELATIGDWARATRSGDISEVGSVAEQSPVWPSVTSTTDNCLGAECPRYGDCFVVKARRQAMEADLVVVNHHLFFADMALREEGFGELLPGVQAFILDEAHQLPDVALRFFGQSMSSRQLANLARDTQLEQQREAGDLRDLPEALYRLDDRAADLRLKLGQGERRVSWQALRNKPGVAEALATLRAQLAEVTGWLETAAPRGRGLENCWRRARILSERLQWLEETPPEGFVQWVETTRRGFSFNFTPIEVAPAFRAHMAALDEASWVFTSATLAVKGRFDHFMQQLGIEDAATAVFESPFDYARNALLYCPPDMPDPNDGRFDQEVAELIARLAPVTGGRMFALFTSHRALQAAAEALEGRLDYPLLVQGEAPRTELLERFRGLGNAVLLGTGSFWEGVDVRGEALSCVLIDRLPFAAPGDPVLQARLEAARAAGANPFMEIQLPEAVIALKQGAGRLIRDTRDRGVLVLCDPRLRSRSYGRLFLDSLPPMRRTQAFDAVESFFAGADRAHCAGA